MTLSVAAADSHALIFALKEPRKLGSAGRRFIERVERGDATLYVPALLLVELAEANRRGTFPLPIPFGQWAARQFESPRFKLADLTLEIIVRSHELYGIPERGDRLIAATALVLGCPLITRDRQIVESAEVDCIW